MPDLNPSANDTEFRDKIADNIIKWVFIAMIVVTITTAAMIFSISHSSRDIIEFSRYVFGTLITLFGTWIGTVLAFYFSAKNFETANRSVKKIVDRLTPEQTLKHSLVRGIMMKIDEIEVAKPKDGMTVEQIPLARFGEILDPSPDSNRKACTRAPVLAADNTPKFMLHRSLYFEFLQKNPNPTAAGDPDTRTLGDILKDADIGPKLSLWVAIDPEATLWDAKARLEDPANEGAQDVFVTTTGARKEPAVGWFTNVDITRAITHL